MRKESQDKRSIVEDLHPSAGVAGLEQATRTAEDGSQLWAFRLVYVATYAGPAVWLPYVALFLESRGRSYTEIGFLCFIPRVFSSVIAPIWSLFADKHSVAREMVIVGNVGSLFHTLLLQLIEPGSSCGLVALLVAMRAFYNCPCGSLIDAISTELLGQLYGEVRGIGALSFAIFSFLGGIALSMYGFPSLFYLYAALQTTSIFILATRLPSPPPKSQVSKQNDDESGEPVTMHGKVEGILKIFRENRDYCRNFALCVFCSGIGFGVVETFLFIRLSALGASGLLLGLARLTMTLVEVPVFWWAKDAVTLLTSRFGVTRTLAVWNLLVLTQVAFFVRFTWYSLLTNPWHVFGAEVLHGLTFALMWGLSVSYSSELAEAHAPSSRATMQTALSGLHFGIAAGLGSAAGGCVYAELGAVVLFRICAVLALVSSVLAASTCATIYSNHLAPASVEIELGPAAASSPSTHGLLPSAEEDHPDVVE